MIVAERIRELEDQLQAEETKINDLLRAGFFIGRNRQKGG